METLFTETTDVQQNNRKIRTIRDGVNDIVAALLENGGIHTDGDLEDFVNKSIRDVEAGHEPAMKWVTVTFSNACYLYNEGYEENEFRQRNLNRRSVRLYAHQMETGNWKPTGEPIIIGSKGELLNGQHRLAACISSGKPFKTVVIVGVNRDMFIHLDSGRKRSHTDNFVIRNTEVPHKMSGICKWIHNYVSLMEREGKDKMGPLNTSEQLLEVYDKAMENNLMCSLPYGKYFNDQPIAPANLMTALHYLCSQKDNDLADSFFKKVGTGLDCKEGENAYLLRSKFISISTKPLEQIAAWDSALLTVLYWNKTRRGETGRIRFQKGKRFPAIE
tara:strand:- start:996 stop:1991 length:996 start_codon:yes stop_codon:yes gene_type:complete